MATRARRVGLYLLCWAILVSDALSASSAAASRRAFCGGISAIACGLGSRSARAAPPQLLRDGDAVRCENGTGEVCDAAAEGIELIKRLQERSRINRERNEADVRARWTKNAGYDEYFAALGQKVVPKEDGTGYMLIPNADFAKLQGKYNNPAK